MAALGDTYTYTDLDTGNIYEFTCINLNPEYWICPTPFFDDWLVNNYGEKDNDGNAYYIINSYESCQQIEDVINHIDQSFHSTATYSDKHFEYYTMPHLPKLLEYLNNSFSISKIILDNKIYLKAVIRNTENKSIIFPTLGYMRDHIIYGLNQACFFTHYIIRNYFRNVGYLNLNSENLYVSFKEQDYDFSALFSTCLSTITYNACIYPYLPDIHTAYIHKSYTFCSTLDLSLAASNDVIIKTPVFIYAQSPYWSK